MYIHKENLISALQIAIDKQREVEKKMNYTNDSALVAGWVEIVNSLNSNQEINFY